MRGATGAAGILVMAVGIAGVAAAQGSDAELAKQDRIAELERKVEVLTEELARMRSEQALPAVGPEDGEDALPSAEGLGPMFSRVYGLDRGLSIGGYAEGFYRHFMGDEAENNPDLTDALRTVLYLGYKFNEHFVFNSEIEFEHATTSSNPDGQSGSVSVEFAALDWLIRDWANWRTGLVLVPMGFLNEVHEPPFYHGVARPEVETRIIPTTWRENGTGLYGSYAEQLDYQIYVVSGLDESGISPSETRGARSNGNRSRSENMAGVVRVDWQPPFLEGGYVGGSVYHGGMQQDREGYPDATMTMWEAHAQYRRWGLELRALVAQALVSDAGELTLARRAASRNPIGPNATIAENWLGWYAEAAFDVMPWIAPESEWYLAPWVRYEWYDTQYRVPSGFESNGALDIALWTPGITFKPHPNVVFKLDYRNFNPDQGKRADEVQFGFGVAF